MSEIANSKDFQALVNGIISGLSILGNYLSYIFDFVCSIAGFFSDNWSTIGPVVKGVATAFGSFILVMFAAETATKLFKLALDMIS